MIKINEKFIRSKKTFSFHRNVRQNRHRTRRIAGKNSFSRNDSRSFTIRLFNPDRPVVKTVWRRWYVRCHLRQSRPFAYAKLGKFARVAQSQRVLQVVQTVGQTVASSRRIETKKRTLARFCLSPL